MDKKILDVFELYAEADKRKVDAFKNKYSSKMDVSIETNKPKYEASWIEKMEETLPYIENILGAPTRLIVNEEEVINIEKIKKVTVESIKHLSRNASLIDDIDDNGDIQPGKLLNVFKEESLNTYENRFIYTLIIKMLTIIRKEKSKLLKKSKSSDKEYRKLKYDGNYYNGKEKVDISLALTSTSESSGMSEDKKDQLDRIRILEKNVVALTLTATYQTLDKSRVLLITPPLKKTNALLKNVNFQYAVKLWDFLIDEMDKSSNSKNEMTVESKQYKDRGKSKKFVDDTFLLNYLILQSVDAPELKANYKKDIVEQLIANMVERTIDVNESISEEELKDIVSKQYTIIKYKRQVTNKELQEIFKSHIAKYVKQINQK